ncbi:MAG TPA: hypothetical protein VHN37_03585 [Actinomycetota bacterium]|nr:hypothetical protein [Actinomycetota bacterium]
MLMLIGALVLLVVAVLDTALDEHLPRWVYVGTYAVGYVLLAYGFFTALNARSGRSSPRDRG